MFKKGKDEEGMKIVFEFQTKKGWSVLVDLERYCTREISFEIPTLTKEEYEALLNISNDLNNKQYFYYLLFSLTQPYAVPSTSFKLCRLKDVWTRVSSTEYHVINLKGSMDIVDFTEMERILNGLQFNRISCNKFKRFYVRHCRLYGNGKNSQRTAILACVWISFKGSQKSGS